jgi:glutathione S-transferase
MIHLHHYAASPWAEVVRLACGLKNLEWASVEAPSINPKPRLALLTGGYTRIPVMQRGADLFCDSAAIVPALEPEPGPSLYPHPGHAALAARAQGPVFFAAVGAALEHAPETGMEAFWQDRQTRFGMEPASFRAMVPNLKAMFAAHLDTLEVGLEAPFLLGDAPGHGDLAHYQLLWFQGPRAETFTATRPRLAAWAARVAALGHGRRTPSDADAAIAAALAAEPAPLSAGVDPASGFTAGQPVGVSQDGCRDAPATGTLVVLNDRRIVIARETAETGRVHVHFPRAGQALAAA